MYHCIIHYNRPHTDQYIVMHRTAMYNRIMANGYIIANSSAVFLIRAMDAGAILHIYFIAQFNKVHITPYHGIEPKTAVITCHYVANNRGIGCNEIIVTNFNSVIKQ